MTWARIKETGSGKLALRFMIEGMPTEWVSDSYLATIASDDRFRKVGFQASCFSFAETVDLTSAATDSNGFTAVIKDIDLLATAEFAGLPESRTWLTQDMATGDTTIHVRSTDGWVVGHTIHVGTECMTIASGITTTTAVVTRGTRNTIVQAHFTADGENLRAPEVTYKKPNCIEGRRCYVYAYGDGETGSGTRIFAGVCSSDASLVNGTEWNIVVDPLTTLLEQSVGGDLEDPVPPRGIHYFYDNRLKIYLTRMTGAGYASGASTTDNCAFTVTSAVANDGTYFFETQEDFCSRVNDLIVSNTAGWTDPLTAAGSGAGGGLFAVPKDDGTWGFQYQVGSTPTWLLVETRSTIDPWFYTNAPSTYSYRGSADVSIVSLTANRMYSLVPAAASPVYHPIPGLGTVPRGVFGGNTETLYQLEAGVDFFRWLYLGGSVSVADAANVSIEWPEESGASGAQELSYFAVDNTPASRRIQLQNQSDDADHVPRIWTSEFLPKIKFSRVTVRGSLYDYVEHICSESQDSANAGYSPLLTEDDINLSEMQVNVANAANGFPFLLERTYAQTKEMKLSEVLGPELLLLGLVTCLDETGKISFRKCRPLAATDAIAGAINSNTRLTKRGPPGWERFQNGSVNDVTLKTGWDPKEDKYNGTTFRVRDVGAYSRNKLARKVLIEPKSFCSVNDATVSYRDIVPVIEPILGLLGYPYDVITIDVKLSLFDVLIGDSVTIAASQVPNSQLGTRGITDAVGIVIGREWAPSEARGTLTVLVSLQNIAGYSPTSRVVSYTGTNPYTFTITAASQPTGYASIAKWNVGDLIEVYNINTASPTTRQGTISSISVGGETITVTLSGAVAGGTLNIDYQFADVIQTSQEVYAFIATDQGFVEYISGNDPPRSFAP